MAEVKEKIYVGSGKKAEKYDLVNISVCLSDLPKDKIFEYNDKKYIKLTVAAKKEVDKYGKSHTVFIDEFEPKAQEEVPVVEAEDDSDLPF
jgi:hypothetical protein